MSLPLVLYVLMGALRDKLILSMLVVFAVTSSLAIFMGSSATVEKEQFTLIFAASALRLVGVLGLVMFCIFFVRRSFDSKDIEFLLSRPVGRVRFVLSYALAFTVLAVVMTCAMGVTLYAVGPHLFGRGHALWLLSIGIENIIMINMAFFFAMYISSAATASMAVLGFYVLGRMMGQLLGIVDSPLIDNDGVIAMALQLVSIITPRLDLIGQTSWLLYGLENNTYGFIYATIQGGVYVLLILAATSLDFLRRQF